MQDERPVPFLDLSPFFQPISTFKVLKDTRFHWSVVIEEMDILHEVLTGLKGRLDVQKTSLLGALQAGACVRPGLDQCLVRQPVIVMDMRGKDTGDRFRGDGGNLLPDHFADFITAAGIDDNDTAACHDKSRVIMKTVT